MLPFFLNKDAIIVFKNRSRFDIIKKTRGGKV